MKIGVFFESLPKEIGGGFTFQETVLRGLPKIAGDHELVVFHYGEAPDLGGAGRLRFHSLGGSGLSRPLFRAFHNALAPLREVQFKAHRAKGESSELVALSPLDSAARKNAIDLMWFPTPSAERVECPYIATVWDLEHRAQPYFPEVAAQGEWEAREKYYAGILPRASYVITGTEVGKREIERFYGVAPERIRLLRHPTPAFALEAAEKPASRPAKLPPGDFLFYPAQFWAHKNHLGLLKTVALLQKKGEPVQLALVGSDKGNRAHIEAAADRLGVSEFVHFLGFVSRDELVYLYRNALALTYASLCGPENLPPLEAFALNCPVIASDIPGAREQLGHAARLVPAQDPEAWAEAVLEWKRMPDARKEYIARGSKRALDYTSEHFLRDLQELFSEFASIRALWA